jgi:hypothetical protein
MIYVIVEPMSDADGHFHCAIIVSKILTLMLAPID